MAQVTISVMGRTYRMACEDGQEDHLTGLAAGFEKIIGELRGSFGEIGDQRLMVMAAILIMDRLRDAEERLERAGHDLRDVRESRRDTVARMESMEENVAILLESAAERIENLARRIVRKASADCAIRNEKAEA
jgi:cell division protein ZapA